MSFQPELQLFSKLVLLLTEVGQESTPLLHLSPQSSPAAPRRGGLRVAVRVGGGGAGGHAGAERRQDLRWSGSAGSAERGGEVGGRRVAGGCSFSSFFVLFFVFLERGVWKMSFFACLLLFLGKGGGKGREGVRWESGMGGGGDELFFWWVGGGGRGGRVFIICFWVRGWGLGQGVCGGHLGSMSMLQPLRLGVWTFGGLSLQTNLKVSNIICANELFFPFLAPFWGLLQRGVSFD